MARLRLPKKTGIRYILVDWVMCMNLIHSEVLIKEYTRLPVRSPPAIAIPQPVLSLLEGDLLPQAPQMYPKLLPMVSTWRQHHDRPEPVNGRLRSTTALSRSAPTEVLLAFLEAHSSLTPSAAQNVRRPWKTEETRRTAILCFCCFGSQVLRQPHRLPRSAAATSTTTTRILSVIEEGMCLNAAAPPAAP